MQRPCGKREPKDTDKAPRRRGHSWSQENGLKGRWGGEGRRECGEETKGRGGGGTGGQEPNHLGFVGLSAKVEALSLFRDSRGRGKAPSRGWPAHTYKCAPGCMRNV